MEAYSKLLTSVAALVGAVVWPLTLLTIFLVFRAELRLIFARIPALLERVKKASLAGVALELDQIVAETEAAPDKNGRITPQQIEAASRIAIQTQELGSQTLLSELDRLCLEYDALRRTLPSGANRTRAMTRVIVKMRTLAPSLVDFIDAYKGSGSAGSRLAAIAMMQMAPRTADINWLKDRFSTEHPFLFYHAALALQNAANLADTVEKKQKLRKVAGEALASVRSFVGIPDQGTIEVLEILLSSLSEHQPKAH